ncbi:MAG TPA: cyclic nucleotide-binding domain-containing protein, partial [Terriglobales bacterium]|nr:cyclic nucleotide-binding domain-containing protein [Terriglobales bacterium]
MAEKSELLRVAAFADLPDDQLAWFISQCEEQVFKPGDTYIRQGDPAENMFVMLEGEFQARGEINGETFSFAIKAGEVTGLL